MNTRYLVIGIVAILVVGGLIWWFTSSRGASVQTSDEQANTANVPPASGVPEAPSLTGTSTESGSGTPVQSGQSGPTTVMVTYDGSSFSPSTVTIHQGDTVMWMDNGNQPMEVASDPHPVHNGYDGTTRQTHCAAGYSGPAPFDECAPGTQFSFTFTKTGSWGYHNHLDQSQGGTVVVQ